MDDRQARIEAARQKAFILYEGRRTPHRSCGICLAETFGLPTRAYQALRRGGLTGEGECGAIRAGTLVLGEILGDPDPTGAPTELLRRGIARYEAIWRDKLRDRVGTSIVCNDLTSRFVEFKSAPRQEFCTSIAADVAAAVATVLVELEVPFEITPPALEDGPAAQS